MKLAPVLFKNVIDRFPKQITRKLGSFPESDAAGWIIAVKTKDGRVFRNVAVGVGFLGHFVHMLGDQSWKRPFWLRDIVDIEWEGYRVGMATQRPEPFREEWEFSSK